MSNDLSRVLRDTLEALQVELREARRERALLIAEIDKLRKENAQGRAARLMRERCLAAIRAAMPDEADPDAVFSRHSLFDVLDDVAGEIERIPVLQ